MSPENHQRVRQLFDEALERPEAERMPFLQAACAGNSEVFEQVAQLLAAHVEAGRFLEGQAALPQHIDRYMVTGELGRGAMGIVYEAIDPLIGRKVAVKVIRLQALADGNEAAFLRERLSREARAAGGLFHPGIAVILDAGQQGDLAFIAMERVEGPSLLRVLAARPKIDRGEALNILQQTAAALDFAHSKGVVHRDIKPANIMLEKGVTVKVADFGIAKITSSQHYTKTGVTMGTPSYMSPEQLDAKPLDGKSDQFSLAVVAYELLTGAKPFQADSFTALAHMIVYAPRPSARAANPELPAGVDPVFCRGLDKLPEERYANCREFVTALEGALTGQVSGAGDATPVAVPRLGVIPRVRIRARKPFRYLVGGAVAAMLLLVAWSVWRTSKPPVIRQFLADPQTIDLGAQTTLIWKVSGATEMAIAPDVGKVSAADRKLVKPLKSTSFVLTATNKAGTVSREASVEVRKPTDGSTSAIQLCRDGESKLRSKRFADGLALVRKAAKLGETHCMVELGEILTEDGEGHIRDDQEALLWFDRAAHAGDPDGMLNLGAFYDLGTGVPENDELAVQWYRKAANLGSSAATYDLGRMYEKGRGVTQDLGKARELYQQAARMGNAEAKSWLAKMGSR